MYIIVQLNSIVSCLFNWLMTYSTNYTKKKFDFIVPKDYQQIFYHNKCFDLNLFLNVKVNAAKGKHQVVILS